jgi:hypothetical protein
LLASFRVILTMWSVRSTGIIPRAPRRGLHAFTVKNSPLKRIAYLWADQGHAHWSNDLTTDSRICHFASWLSLKGYDKQYAQLITAGVAVNLIGAYLHWVKTGNALPSTSRGPLSKQSLRDYVNAASHCVTLLTAQPCIVTNPTTFFQLK